MLKIISEQELRQLLFNSALLDSLKIQGVEDWDRYKYAVKNIGSIPSPSEYDNLLDYAARPRTD